MSSPTPSAMRAAEAIVMYTGCGYRHTAAEFARIIDHETGLAELVEAMERIWLKCDMQGNWMNNIERDIHVIASKALDRHKEKTNDH